MGSRAGHFGVTRAAVTCGRWRRCSALPQGVLAGMLLLLMPGVLVHAYSAADPNADHLSVGIEFAENDEMEAAVESFRAAARFAPTVAENWYNLGTALRDDDYPLKHEKASRREAQEAFRRRDSLLRGDGGKHPSGEILRKSLLWFCSCVAMMLLSTIVWSKLKNSDADVTMVPEDVPASTKSVSDESSSKLKPNHDVPKETTRIAKQAKDKAKREAQKQAKREKQKQAKSKKQEQVQSEREAAERAQQERIAERLRAEREVRTSQVRLFREATGVSEDVSRRMIEKFGGNLDMAVGAYFEEQAQSAQSPPSATRDLNSNELHDQKIEPTEVNDGVRRDIEGKEQSDVQMEAAEQAKRTAAQKKVKREAEETAQKAKRDAELIAKRNAEEKVKREAEEKTKREEKAKRVAEEKAKRVAEEKAKRVAEEKAKRVAEEEAKRVAEKKAKFEAEEQAKLKAKEKARQAQAVQHRELLEAQEEERRQLAQASREAEEQTRLQMMQEEDVLQRLIEVQEKRTAEELKRRAVSSKPTSSADFSKADPVGAQTTTSQFPHGCSAMQWSPDLGVGIVGGLSSEPKHAGAVAPPGNGFAHTFAPGPVSSVADQSTSTPAQANTAPETMLAELWSKVNHYIHVGEADKAREILLQLRGSLTQPNVGTYTALLNIYVHRGDTVKACEVLDEMKAANVQPNAITYNSLLNAFCKAGDTNSARGVMVVMREDGVEPNVRTYTSLLDCYAKGVEDSYAQAEQIVSQMRDNGVELTSRTYGALIRCCWPTKGGTRVARPEEAQRWFCQFLDTLPQGELPDGVTCNMFQKVFGADVARDLCSQRGIDFDSAWQPQTSETDVGGKKHGTRRKDSRSKEINKGYAPRTLGNDHLLHGRAPDNECKVWFGNIDYRVTEEELEGAIRKYIDVDPAQVCIHVDQATGRSRGFAFVRFSTPEEAKQALCATIGIPVRGRPLRANIVGHDQTATPGSVAQGGKSAVERATAAQATLQRGVGGGSRGSGRAHGSSRNRGRVRSSN